MRTILLLLLFCGSCFKFPATQNTVKPQSAVLPSLDATVALVNEEGKIFCSGVVTESVVLTAYHCVDDRTEVNIGFLNDSGDVGAIIRTEVFHVVPDHDFAILRGKDKQLAGGRPLAPNAPRWGERVVVVGHPLGLGWTMTTGIVSHPKRHGGVTGKQTWMQISAQVYFGNSGGPVFNVYGEVVGIVSFLAREPHLGGAVHYDIIKKALNDIKKES